MKINFKARQLIRSASKGYFSSEFNPKNFKNIKTGFSNSFSYSTFTMVAFDYDLCTWYLYRYEPRTSSQRGTCVHQHIG